MIPRYWPGALLHIWHGLGTDLRNSWLECWNVGMGCWLGVLVHSGINYLAQLASWISAINR